MDPARMTALADFPPPSGAVARAHTMPHGATLLPRAGVRFALWAPAFERIAIEIDGNSAPMTPEEGGWHIREDTRATVGTRYRFILPNGMRVPDPASRYQPEDVSGPSEVIDPTAYAWRDGLWQGRQWHEAVIYELHIGTFTQEGTFLAAIGKLDHLKSLGVTAIEIMPIADFPGRWNWGYDGVLPYAPDSSYGTPDHLKQLIDAAHARGIMVFLDVVYNHFGPDGNYLPVYAPQFFTDRHHTPWGSAVNYDGPHSRSVREFIIHNALYWIEEFHMDGLRLDAVHAIIDDSTPDLLHELAARVRSLAGDRHVHLILENEGNQAGPLARDDGGRPVAYTAQWNDDVHHVLHTATTGEDGGYYADYLGDTGKLVRALAEGFAFQGQVMAYRGRPRGEPSRHLPPTAFVTYIQNHDQIGNRAFGERLGVLLPPEKLRAIAATYLLMPQIPMLFMGEEWNAAQPFPFFCDFPGDLADAIRNGRREEFSRFPEFQDPEKRARIPDPLAYSTFASAKLDWTAFQKPPHADWLAWYRHVLATRHDTIVPLIPNIHDGAGQHECLGDGAVSITWTVAGHARLRLDANFSAIARDVPPPNRVIWQEGDPGGPWSVRWSFSF
jgi:malto-oligosyltrehalose trehalohydrolase